MMRYFSLTAIGLSSLSALLLQNSIIAADPSAVSLFNGEDLTGWNAFLFDRGKPDTSTPVDTVWRSEEGVLICKGRPTGYLRTKTEHANYVLTFDWRFPAGSSGGNSGVSVHATTPNALGQWPKSIEVQLFRRNAGDFWVLPFDTTLNVKNEAARRKGRRYLNLTDDSENPIGEWNKMEITCRGDEIIVKVNDDLVNHATNCSIQKGAICLLSEGAEIHFRNLVLTQSELDPPRATSPYRRLDIKKVEDVYVVAFVNRILREDEDIYELGQEMDRFVAGKRDPNILLDLRAVEILSDSAMGKLLIFEKRVKTQSGQVKLCNLHSDIAEIFKLIRLDQVFEIHDNQAEGLKAF